MADANVPETVDSVGKADAGIPRVPVASDPSVTDASASAGVKVVDEPVKATSLEPEAAAPQPAAVDVPIKAPKVSRVAKSKPAGAKAPVVKPVLPKAIKAPKPVRKPAVPKPATISVTNKKSSVSQLKDTNMATSKTPDFAKGVQDAIADVQSKAKAAFEKGTASLGEVSEFTKGNVEALVESGKIFAAGAQNLGSTYVTEGRTAFETLTADVKELAAAKNPTDFFKLQGDLARRNFDTAIAAGSKNSEALLKLINEAFAPISGRVSLAVDKVKQAA